MRRVPSASHRPPLRTYTPFQFRSEREALAYELKNESHRSFSNLYEAARQLQGLTHVPFGTRKVEQSSLSVVRRISDKTGLSYAEIAAWAKARRPV